MPPFPMNLPFDRMEMRQDLDGRTDGQAVYQGFTAPGTATDSSHWLVYKYSYSGSFITRRQVRFKITWDERGTAGVFE